MRFFTLLMLVFTISGYAQSIIVDVAFIPTFLHHPIVLENETYPLSSGDSISFDSFRFYISNISTKQKSGWVKHKTPPHLFDISDSNSFHFSLGATSKFNELRFDIGIDSITNVSGALGGDLDPTKGMYWTWQSGYVNMKLEGKSNRCPTRKNAFQFHVGGYNRANNALQTVTLQTEHWDNINIEISLDEFFKQIDLAKQNQIMSPGKDAVEISSLFSYIFSVIPK